MDNALPSPDPNESDQNEAGEDYELRDASDESDSDDNMDIDLGAWDTGDEAEAGALPSIKKDGLVIDKDVMTRILRDVSMEIAPNYNWQSSAVEAIHEAAEAFLIGQFSSAQMIASQKENATVEAKDMRLAANITGIMRSERGMGASSGPAPLFGFGSSVGAGGLPFGEAQIAPPTSTFPPTGSQLTQDASNLAINSPPTIMRHVQTAHTATARFGQTSTSVTDTSGNGSDIGQESKETKKYWTRSQKATAAKPSTSVYTTNRFAATSSSSSPPFSAHGREFSFTPRLQPTQFSAPPNVDNSSVPIVNLAAVVPPQPQPAQPAMVFTQKPLDKLYSPVIPMPSTAIPVWSAERDSLLEELVEEYGDHGEWMTISREMQNLGHNLNSGQCMDRWWYYLAPEEPDSDPESDMSVDDDDDEYGDCEPPEQQPLQQQQQPFQQQQQPSLSEPAQIEPPSELGQQQSNTEPATNGRRFRPGDVALRAIREQQQNQELTLINGLSFQRAVAAIAWEIQGDLRFQKSAIQALQEATEAFLVSQFEDANLHAMSTKRVTLLPVDQAFAHERKGIKRDSKGRLHWDNYNYKEATMSPTDNITMQSPATALSTVAQSPARDALEAKLVYQENEVVVTITKSMAAADVISLARTQFAQQLENIADADLIVYVCGTLISKQRESTIWMQLSFSRPELRQINVVQR